MDTSIPNNILSFLSAYVHQPTQASYARLTSRHIIKYQTLIGSQSLHTTIRQDGRIPLQFINTIQNASKDLKRTLHSNLTKSYHLYQQSRNPLYDIPSMKFSTRRGKFRVKCIQKMEKQKGQVPTTQSAISSDTYHVTSYEANSILAAYNLDASGNKAGVYIEGNNLHKCSCSSYYRYYCIAASFLVRHPANQFQEK